MGEKFIEFSDKVRHNFCFFKLDNRRFFEYFFDDFFEFFSKKFSKKLCESGLFRYRFKVKTFAIKVRNFTSGLHCSHYLLPFFSTTVGVHFYKCTIPKMHGGKTALGLA